MEYNGPFQHTIYRTSPPHGAVRWIFAMNARSNYIGSTHKHDFASSVESCCGLILKRQREVTLNATVYHGLLLDLFINGSLFFTCLTKHIGLNTPRLDLEEWIRGVAFSGYATNPATIETRIVALISRCNDLFRGGAVAVKMRVARGIVILIPKRLTWETAEAHSI